MEGSVDLKLRDIIDRHGRILIDDPRRCEACLRDADLADRDRAALSAVLKHGFGRRLLSLPEGAFGPQTLSAFSAELAEQSGLKDDLCRRAVEAWAHAFRIEAAGPLVEPPVVAARPLTPEPPNAAQGGLGGQAVGHGVVAPPEPAFSVGQLLRRFGFIVGTTLASTVAGTIFALLWGVLQALLAGRSPPNLQGALVVGFGFYGALGALGGAVMGKDAAEESGRAGSRQVDIASWVFAGMLALFCFSTLVRH